MCRVGGQRWGGEMVRDVGPGLRSPHGRERGHSIGMLTGYCPLHLGMELPVEMLKCLEEMKSRYKA